jgi:hypothetical protein
VTAIVSPQKSNAEGMVPAGVCYRSSNQTP